MYSINNIDITIILEKPYLRDEIVKIRESISNLISIDIKQISIKSSSNFQNITSSIAVPSSEVNIEYNAFVLLMLLRSEHIR